MTLQNGNKSLDTYALLDDGSERTILLHSAAQTLQLRGKSVKPLLLLGADQTHLITPTQPVKLGPPGAPVAIKTRLGWTLQGPARDFTNSSSTHFHYISFKCPPDDIYHNVHKLWQLDALPQRNMKAVVRSKPDQEAMHQLETQTIRTPVDGILRYATPLLRVEPWPPLKAAKEAVMSRLRSCEG